MLLSPASVPPGSLSRPQARADLRRVHAEGPQGARGSALLVAERGEQQALESDRLLAAGRGLPQHALEDAARVARDRLAARRRLVARGRGVLPRGGVRAPPRGGEGASTGP